LTLLHSSIDFSPTVSSADDHSIPFSPSAWSAQQDLCKPATMWIVSSNPGRKAGGKLTAHHLAGKPQRLTVPHRFPLLHS